MNHLRSSEVPGIAIKDLFKKDWNFLVFKVHTSLFLYSYKDLLKKDWNEIVSLQKKNKISLYSYKDLFKKDWNSSVVGLSNTIIVSV